MPFATTVESHEEYSQYGNPMVGRALRVPSIPGWVELLESPFTEDGLIGPCLSRLRRGHMSQRFPINCTGPKVGRSPRAPNIPAWVELIEFLFTEHWSKSHCWWSSSQLSYGVVPAEFPLRQGGSGGP